jgi:TolA-binding protein
MATDSAPPREYARRLWQLPTFLVGLAALWALWEAGDRLRPSVADRYQRAIDALRPAVDRWPPDPDQVQAALRKLPREAPPPKLEARVRYLTGSAYVALAESTTSSAEATEWWAEARRELEAARLADLPAPDQKKLQYRLARAWYHTPDSDPAKTVVALSTYLSAGDDPAEGYRLLADLHLSANPPREPQARESLQNFLKHASARADARTLNEARVRLSELHAKAGDTEEARKVLARVGPEAPAEIHAKAHLLLAGYGQAEGDWAAAAREWEVVCDMKGATDEQRGEARVHLAEAYVKLGRPGDAEAVVREGGRTDRPEGRAVIFRRAELKLKDPAASKEAIVRDLEAAFTGADAASLRRLVPVGDAKRVCETVVRQMSEAGQFALAARAANAYGRIAENGDQHRLVAVAQEAWADALAAGPGAGEEAKEHYRSAAAACEAVDNANLTPPRKGDWLRKAAMLYVKANGRSKALAVLGELTTRISEYPEDQAGQAWAEMGDVYLLAGDREQARVAFQNAGGRPGPTRNKARVRFAALANETDAAKSGAVVTASLEEIVGGPTADASDPAVHEEAMFLLGESYLLQKEWAKADARIRAALDAYPASPRAARAHYQYGQVLRHGAYEAAAKIKADRATMDEIKQQRLDLRQPAHRVPEQIAIEDRMEKSQKSYDEMMRRAYDEFSMAEKMLSATRDADPAVVRRTMFWAADCAYWLGEFAACAERCEKIGDRYKDEVEELEAGRDLYRCCVFAAEAARAKKDGEGAAGWSRRAIEAHGRVKESLARIPATEFDGTTETRKKAYWETWLVENGPRAKAGD